MVCIRKKDLLKKIADNKEKKTIKKQKQKQKLL